MKDYKHFPRIPRDYSTFREVTGIVISLCLFVTILTIMGWGVVSRPATPTPTLVTADQLRVNAEVAMKQYTAKVTEEMEKAARK